MNLLETSVIIEKVLLWTICLLIVFDIYLYLNKAKGDTISYILKSWVYDKYFFITFLWGVLAGHFFLGTSDSLFEEPIWGLLIVLEITLILFIFGMFCKIKIKPLVQALLLIFGVLIGHFFWSLN